MSLQTGSNHRTGRLDHGKRFWKAVAASFSQWHGHRTPPKTHLKTSGIFTANECVRTAPGKLHDGDSLRCEAQKSRASASSRALSQLLNSTIDRCSSTVGLANILEQHHTSMDAVHLCMMMTKLQRLAPRRRDALQPTSPNSLPRPALSRCAGAGPSPTQAEVIHQLAIDITSTALEDLPHLTPRHCSTLLSGLSQCSSPGLPPPVDLIQALTSRAVERAAFASVHDLVQLLHAVTALNSLPTLPQLTVLLVQLLQYAQLQRKEKVPRIGPQDVSMTLWSLATMQQHPGPIWLDSFLLCCAPQLPEYRPQALANSMWAVATLAHQPPTSWMEGALTAAHAQLPSYPPQELSTLLWALATLRYVPPTEFLADAWQQLHDRCASLNAQDVSNALWACSQFGHRPSAPVLTVLAAHATSQVHSYSPQALCNVLEAFRRLKVSTPGQMLRAALTEAATSNSILHGRDIASLLNSVAGTCTPREALDIGDAAFQTSLEVTALTTGDGRLLQKLLSSCCARPSSDFTAHDLVLVGQAVAELRQVLEPDERWVQWWLVSTLPKMRSSRGRALSRLCETAASLHASPPAAWLGACMAAVSHRMGELQPADLVTLCGALKSMSQPSTPALVHQAGYSDEDRDNWRPMQQQQPTSTQEVVRIALSDSMMSQLRRQVTQHASEYSVRQLSGVVRSMAMVEAAMRVTAHSDNPLQRWRPYGTTPSKAVVRPKAVKRKIWRLMRKTRYKAMPGGVAGRLAGPGSGRQALRYDDTGAQQLRQAYLDDTATGETQDGHHRGLNGPPSRFLIARRVAAAATLDPGAAGTSRHASTTQEQRQPQTHLQHGPVHSTGSASQARAETKSFGSSSKGHEMSDKDLREELTLWYGMACLLSLSASSSRRKLGELCSLRGYDAIPQLPIARVQGRLEAQSRSENMHRREALRLGL